MFTGGDPSPAAPVSTCLPSPCVKLFSLEACEFEPSLLSVTEETVTGWGVELSREYSIIEKRIFRDITLSPFTSLSWVALRPLKTAVLNKGHIMCSLTPMRGKLMC